MKNAMPLSKLFNNYSVNYVFNPQKLRDRIQKELPNNKITGLCYHSQNVSKNELFFCLKGFKEDGHNFAYSAYENGAEALVVEDPINDIQLPQVVVSNSRNALSYISSEFYNHPSSDINMIGITSTNGKTTTTYMIDRILSWNKKTGLLGTVMVKIGENHMAAGLTTPESLDLQKYLDNMRDCNIEFCTMEVSSSGLELERVSSVDYDIAIVNNISRDHIDLHGSFEAYYEAKKRLVSELKTDSYAILNVDCENTRALITQTPAQLVTYSVNGRDASVQVENLDLSTGRPSFTINVTRPLPTLTGELIKPFKFDIQLKVLGLHNVYNAVSAAITTLLSGESPELIVNRLKTFTGVERRFQLIYENEYKIIDDHFANPGNIAVTLNTLRFMDYNKLKILYAIRGSRGETVNKENVKTLLSWASKLELDEIIVTSSQDVVTNHDKVTEAELNLTLNVFREAGLNVKFYSDLTTAIEYVLDHSNISKNDVLLLAGCQGMDHGARIALNHLYNTLTVEEQRKFGHKLLEPLQDRVAGFEETS